jgi:hypothetical protein
MVKISKQIMMMHPHHKLMDTGSLCKTGLVVLLNVEEELKPCNKNVFLLPVLLENLVKERPF